jgi:thioredoxin-dependent peroxiredoxin
MLKVGDIAPDFELTNQQGKKIKLSHLTERGKVVVYFYPKDETRGCTAEACGFRDKYQQFKDAGAEVLGISSDSVQSHQSFSQNHNLNFHLLSDSGNKVRKAYGVPNTLFFIPGRVTFVVDKNGLIVSVFNSMRKFEEHVAQALKAIKEN